MSDTSPRLELPYLLPSQAQKHVTHNEALKRLDVLVQLSVLALDAETPPAVPGPGDVHGLGPAPTGVWAGHAGDLAFWDGVAWSFLAPQAGWRAWDQALGGFCVHDGTGWTPVAVGTQMLDGVGIGTTSDATNRLAVTGDATLLSHAGAGHQLKLNKAGTGDTASVLFQSGWTGHAEIGLAGSDDFALKVSADGNVWVQALRVTPGAMQVDVPITGSAIQSSNLEAVSGQALRYGAFGLGTTTGVVAPGNDANQCLNTGLSYRFATGGLNCPIADPYGGTLLALSSNEGGEAKQIFLNRAGTNMWFRGNGTGGWSSWQKVLDEDAVQTSATDTTADALLTVGAFGLGEDAGPILTNIDTHTTAGFYYGYGGSHASATPGTNPFPALNGGFQLLHMNGALGGTSEYQVQIAASYSSPEVVFRTEAAAGWSAWRRLLDSSQVQTSATDTTADALMTVGAFGLGNTGLATNLGDWDATDTPSGLYVFSVGTANGASRPTGYASGNFGYVRVERYNTPYVTQTAWRAAGTPMPMRRRYVNGVWDDWTPVYEATNILGTVSESGGVPTGAVIERGSNANGEYVRFADGTQICTRSNTAITTAPMAFSGTITKIDGDKLWIGRWF